MCALNHSASYWSDKYGQTIQFLTSAQTGFNMLHSNCQSGTTLTSLVKKEPYNSHNIEPIKQYNHGTLRQLFQYGQ